MKEETLFHYKYHSWVFFKWRQHNLITLLFSSISNFVNYYFLCLNHPLRLPLIIPLLILHTHTTYASLSFFPTSSSYCHIFAFFLRSGIIVIVSDLVFNEIWIINTEKPVHIAPVCFHMGNFPVSLAWFQLPNPPTFKTLSRVLPCHVYHPFVTKQV